MFVANGPCRFGGRPYVKGETIPSEYIDLRGAKRLVDSGILKEVFEDTNPLGTEKIDVVVYHEENTAEEPAKTEEPETVVVQEEPVADDPKEALSAYEEMSKKDLLELARKKGLDVKSSMSKTAIIEILGE